MFVVPPEKRASVHAELIKKATTLELASAKEIPVGFIQSGVEIVHNSDKNISL
jgi:hypothetical protein